MQDLACLYNGQLQWVCRSNTEAKYMPVEVPRQYLAVSRVLEREG